MYKPRRLQFTEQIGRSRFSFDFQLRGTVIVLYGDSGTGKTLFYKALAKEKNSGWYEKQFGGKVYLFSDDSSTQCSNFLRDTMPQLKNALVVFENASNYLSQEDFQRIVCDFENYYVIITRSVSGLQITPNYFAEVFTDKNGVLRLKYRYSKQGWY